VVGVVRKASGDEMTLWVEEEMAATSSAKRARRGERKGDDRGVGESQSDVVGGASTKESGDVHRATEHGEGTKSSGVQLTERDLEVLGWIGDQYAVRTDIIRWLLGDGRPLSDSRARAIVARWQRAGLVDSRRFFAGTPNVVWLTRRGTALVRPGWRSRPPNVAMLAHHHAVSQVRLAIERRAHGTDWVSERVLYKHRSTPDAHVADGTFRSSRGPVTAVEVELTLKSSDRVRDIVRDLTLDHEAVLYVVGSPTIGRAVDGAARSLGESGRVHVLDLARVVIDAA
jgi:hypothetical protein